MSGPLQMKRVMVDPLGGLLRDEKSGAWLFQKKPVAGIPGDVITAEIAILLYDMLKIVEADVLATRCLRRNFSETGESGQPLFYEGAGQYLKYCRVRPSLRESRDSDSLPREVWGDGDNAAERDARARLKFSRHAKSEVLISLDVTHYATDEGFEVGHNGVGEAKALAEKIVQEVSKRTRRRPAGVRELLDEERAYAGLACPAVIANCGSSWDPFTTRLLKNPWYRSSIALGVLGGLWKHYGAVLPA